MVMKAGPLGRSVQALKSAMPGARTVLMSPQGARFSQVKARKFAAAGSIILVAGRYEGVDERFVERFVDEELSLGDFVLSGGEIAAMAVIDAVSRLVPGVLGHPESANEDSFGALGLLDCPHYTRPENFEGSVVPEILLSGNHQAIATWRRQQALQRTQSRRPDLIKTAELDRDDEQFLETIAAANASGHDR
jgi:tRNA (guanine37-N1)-methyltransferase